MATLLDPEVFSTSELATLYRRRWQVGLNFRHIKVGMKMDVLKCNTVDGVLEGPTMFGIAYDLIRSARAEGAMARGVSADRVGFADASRRLTGPGPGEVGLILINPRRPDRAGPRVRKRRPERYPLRDEPRFVLRDRLMGKADAA